MKTKLSVAIIGAAETLGAAIAKAISKGNYRILLQAEEANETEVIAGDILNINPLADVAVLLSEMEASWEADIIILAIPYEKEKGVVEKIRSVTNQKVVVSTSNPYGDNSTSSSIATGSAAEQLQQLLPNARVIKAFNTMAVNGEFHPVINGVNADCYIAGNDEDALQILYELVKAAGFTPVITGDLTVSGTLEQMQVLLNQLNMQHKYQSVAGWKLLHP